MPRSTKELSRVFVDDISNTNAYEQYDLDLFKLTELLNNIINIINSLKLDDKQEDKKEDKPELIFDPISEDEIQVIYQRPFDKHNKGLLLGTIDQIAGKDWVFTNTSNQIHFDTIILRQITEYVEELNQ